MVIISKIPISVKTNFLVNLFFLVHISPMKPETRDFSSTVTHFLVKKKKICQFQEF